MYLEPSRTCTVERFCKQIYNFVKKLHRTCSAGLKCQIQICFVVHSLISLHLQQTPLFKTSSNYKWYVTEVCLSIWHTNCHRFEKKLCRKQVWSSWLVDVVPLVHVTFHLCIFCLFVCLFVFFIPLLILWIKNLLQSFMVFLIIFLWMIRKCLVSYIVQRINIYYADCGVYVDFWNFLLIPFPFMIDTIILNKSLYFGLSSFLSNSILRSSFHFEIAAWSSN